MLLTLLDMMEHDDDEAESSVRPPPVFTIPLSTGDTELAEIECGE